MTKNLVLLLMNNILSNENEPNDLVRYLDFSKIKSDLMTFRIKKWNLLQNGDNVCSFRTRQQSFVSFFILKGGLVYCTNVMVLCKNFGIPTDQKNGDYLSICQN